MRCSANLITCCATLICACLGCDLASSNSEPRTVYIYQTDPRFSEKAEITGTSVNGSPSGEHITLVSNNSTSATSAAPNEPALPQQPKLALPEHTPQVSLPNSPIAPSVQSSNQTKTETANQVSEGQFKPPFAERSNVFAPPSTNTSTQQVVGGEIPSVLPVEDVTLKGFAKVDDQRAILMIEDTIAPLGLGQEKHGIKVVSIEPPKVTLERGGDRWTLTLSNQFTPTSRPSNSR